MTTKICESCHKPFEPARPSFRYCPQCAAKFRSRPAASTLPNGYLEGGYFVVEQGKRVLRPEVVDQWAQAVARVLGNSGVTSHQLRRFFGKMQAIRAKLEGGAAFAEVRPEILAFKRDSAYQVGRGVVGQDFKRFIDLNVDEAAKSLENFEKGFTEHFRSVLAYFVYFFRNR